MLWHGGDVRDPVLLWGVSMARRKPWEVSDDLRAVIEPLLPKHERRFRYPGRKRIDDPKTLQGVLFVLYTGVQREYLPQELGFGSGPTCWRRPAEWQEAGVREELQRVLPDGLRAADPLDFSRAAIDASHVQAKRGRSSPKVGPGLVDRARPGSKHHVPTDARGTPLRVSLTGGHRHDVTRLLPLIDSLGPVRGKRGRPRRKPRTLYADRGYDYDIYRRRLRERGITPKTARRGRPHGSGPGKVRWVAESAIAWLHGPRRLRIRWEVRDDMQMCGPIPAYCPDQTPS
ncbi:transposase, IS4 family [Streptomyces ipomoeae 91-03]|uniref:Transposase, IS4 family n=3 Tax=Streptomyces ipomoeae TaxID=103232 RepID=L1L4U7_9ACTN|nr:transposase, IS4 family [Streptomyces ipomoeae 91-03]